MSRAFIVAPRDPLGTEVAWQSKATKTTRICFYDMVLKCYYNGMNTHRNRGLQNELDAVNNQQNAFPSPGRAKKRTAGKITNMRTYTPEPPISMLMAIERDRPLNINGSFFRTARTLA